MSSLRNAVKRVTHKERSQPSHRSHLGILEKHKDYTKRARDYHSKQEKLTVLREKADQRNPDEFYFGMHKSYVDRESGRHKKLAAARQKELEHLIGPDAIKMMKQQDLTAVKLQLQQDNKRIKKLEQNLHLIGATASKKRKHKHTIFVDTKEELKKFDAPQHFGTVPELMERSYNRPTVDQLLSQSSQLQDPGYGDNSDEIVLTEKQLAKQRQKAKVTARKAAKARLSAYREVHCLQKRKEKLSVAQSHLETEQNLRGKGKRRKIKPAEQGKPAVYRWSKVRKK